MIKNRLNQFKSIFDYTIVLTYSFFFVGTTLVGNIQDHVEIINNLISSNLDSPPFFIESPTLLIAASYFKFSNIESFALFLFIFLLSMLFLIVLTSQFLGNFNYIFLFSGWIITVNWWVGYTDIILVFTTLGILRILIKNHHNPLILVFCIIGSFSHLPIHFFILLNILILFIEKIDIRNILYIVFGTLSGMLLNGFYLTSIGVNNSKRLEILMSYDSLSNSLKSLANNNLIIFYSGFSSAFLIFICLIYFLYMQNKKLLFKIYFSILVSLICSGLGLDSSRIFSLVIIPIVVWLIYNIETLRESKYYKQILFASFLVVFLLGPVQVWENDVYFQSPFSDFYIFKFFIPQIWYLLGI